MPDILLESVIALIALCIGSYYVGLKSLKSLKNGIVQWNQLKSLKIPGPPGLPIVGNSLDFLVPHSELFKLQHKWVKQYGARYRLRIGIRLYISMSGREDVQKVLSSTTHIDKSADYDMLMPWLGTGLLTSQGQKWYQRRKMLTPTFHFKILDDFLDVFNEQAEELVKIFQTEFISGNTFNIFPYVTRCALDIICETAMGKKINAQQERDTDYVKAIYRISELIQHRQVRPWLHPDLLWKLSPSGREEKTLLHILHSFTENVIRERKSEFLLKQKEDERSSQKDEKEDGEKKDEDVYMKGKRRVAFLDLLLTAQQSQSPNEAIQLTDLDIREETDTFMFEGHDTTAANVNWTTFLLGSYPEYQAKVQEELDEIFGEDRNRRIRNQDLAKMKYLECCIKESLRLYPSVPFIARSIKTDLELDEETTVPAGTTAFIMPYQLHRDPSVFPEPEVFLPDRFFPENCVGRNPFAYVPFSAGPRNCIGQKFAMMEEKVILANIFRNFRVEAAERREDLILLAELIMRPKYGLHVKISPRP